MLNAYSPCHSALDPDPIRIDLPAGDLFWMRKYALKIMGNQAPKTA